MALHPDMSDPALLDALDDVRNEKTATNWVIYGYVPKTDKITVDQTGTGGLAEMLDCMSDGKVHYCFIRFNVNGVYKYVYISWCGEGVAGLRKGSFAGHAVDMGKLLHGYHVQINARSESDIDEKDILSRLARATGSHGRQSAKARFQGAASENATPGGVSASQSAIGAERPFEKRSQPLISKEESEAFWNKQREIDQASKQASAYVPQRVNPDYNLSAGSASNLRERFSNPSSFERPVERTAPSIPRAAPPAAAPAPAPLAPTSYAQPEPEPAHEPEPAYAQPEPEPAHEPEPAYEQPEQTYHEPAPEYEEQASTYQESDYNNYQDDGGYQQHDVGVGTYQEEAYQADAGGYQEAGTHQSGTGLQCRALYDYTGENEGDLSFNEGDTIDVLDQSDSSGWWQGSLNGAVGFFPSNFVEQI